MSRQFEVAYGSVVGTAHSDLSQNNQDALFSLVTDRYELYMVADGCGDPSVGFHSELGAQIGIRIIAQVLSKHLNMVLDQRIDLSVLGTKSFWQRIKRDSLYDLYTVVLSMHGEPTDLIRSHFLFALLGILVTSDTTIVFGIGDGVFSVNGQWTTIGPFPDNRPPYLSYNLLDSHPHPLLDFQLHRVMKTSDLQTFFIGTDGVSYLIAAATRNIPGEQEVVGSIEQLWEDEYFESPYSLKLRLKLLSQPQYIWTPKELVFCPGLLPDDTTIIVGRRVQTVENKE